MGGIAGACCGDPATNQNDLSLKNYRPKQMDNNLRATFNKKIINERD